MATQFIVDLNLSYSDELVIDTKDAVTLIDILNRSKRIRNMYRDNIFTLENPIKPKLSLLTDEVIMTTEAYEEYQAMKAAADATVNVAPEPMPKSEVL
jgi:hypothetical protein